MLTARKLLQKKMLDIELGLRGVLRGFGLRLGKISKGRFAGRVQELASGNPMLERVTEGMLRARDALRAEMTALDKRARDLARDEAFRAQGKLWGVMRKAPKGGKLHPIDERINRIIASLRAKVEHPFRVMKCQFGYRKTRYRGLAKNEAQLFSLFGLGNLFLVRRRLIA